MVVHGCPRLSMVVLSLGSRLVAVFQHNATTYLENGDRIHDYWHYVGKTTAVGIRIPCHGDSININIHAGGIGISMY